MHNSNIISGKLKRIKIALRNGRQSAKLQRKLFGKGCRWGIVNKNTPIDEMIPLNTSARYLFVDEYGCIAYSNSSDFYWKSDYSVVIPEEILKPNGFDKGDLIPGLHIIETRGCERMLVLAENVLIPLGFENTYTWSDLSKYTHDLLVKPDTKIYDDIVKVYAITRGTDNFSLNDMEYMDLVWERNEEQVLELTIEEIEEKYGSKVKIVGENK